MEQILNLKNSLGVIDSRKNDRLSTLVLAKDKNEIGSMLKKIKDSLDNVVEKFDVVCLGEGFSDLNAGLSKSIGDSYESVENMLLDLVKYSHKCKRLITKKGYSSRFEFNRVYKIFDYCRTVVVIPNIDLLLQKSASPRLVKDCIVQLLKLEEYSLVSVIACSSLSFEYVVDFQFFNSFANRALFNVDDNKVVEDASLGMYRTTKMLGSNEYYYFTSSGSNGIMMCI